MQYLSNPFIRFSYLLMKASMTYLGYGFFHFNMEQAQYLFAAHTSQAAKMYFIAIVIKMHYAFEMGLLCLMA